MAIQPIETDAEAPGGAEPTQWRMRLVTEATGALEATLDADRALDRLGELLVPALADVVVVALLDETGELRPVALRHADPALARCSDLLHELARPVPGGLVERALVGEPAILIDAAGLTSRTGVDSATRRCLLELGVTSLVACPLRVRSEQLGALIAGTTSTSDRQLEPADLELLCGLSSIAAQAVDAARLFKTMRVAEDRFAAAFDFAPIGMGLVAGDRQLRPVLMEANPALCEILGRPEREVVERGLSDFVHPDDASDLADRLRGLLASDSKRSAGEVRFVRPDGEVRRCGTQSAALDAGNAVIQVQDVTDHRRSQAELEHLTSHDGLTRLLNRPGFEAALSHALANSHRHGDEGAVAVIDLDAFKHLNDTCGIAAGDELLRAVARTLADRLRDTDALARLGDDEFGIVLTRTNAGAAKEVLEELLDAIRGIELPVRDRMVRTTASAGLRSFSRGTRPVALELVGEADAAMLDAKECGRDRLSVVHAGERHSPRRVRMRWSERIRRALEDNRFVLYEQPIMRIADRVVEGSELLLRMLDDNGEPVAPGLFLPAAERYGQICAIDEWVVEHAIDLVERRHAAGIDAGVNLNLSADTLSDEQAVERIAERVRSASIEASRLTFEITETAAVRNTEWTRRLACRLVELGCGFALDDFGAGFSTFAHLKHLPVDTVKIDGQFIRELSVSQADQLTVQAVVDIASGLGISTTAEFVGDETTLALLAHLGVDRAQGFHVGRPRPATVEPRWVSV